MAHQAINGCMKEVNTLADSVSHIAEIREPRHIIAAYQTFKK